MAISTRKFSVTLLLILGCSLLGTKAQDEEAPAPEDEETVPEEPPAGETDPETPEEPPAEETVAEEGEQAADTETAVEEDVDTEAEGEGETDTEDEGETEAPPESEAEGEADGDVKPEVEGEVEGEGEEVGGEGEAETTVGVEEEPEEPAGEEPTEAATEELEGTTEEAAPAEEAEETEEKESTAEPETTTTAITPTTTPACEPTDHWKISSLIVPPFLQEATNSSNSTGGGGGGQYEGYIVDLLDEITRHLCVSYEISLAADGKFGSQNGDDWTGIIGDVVKGDANVGAGPITVTMNREKAVDFTNPIYSFEAVTVRLRPPGPSDDLQISSTNDLLNEEFKFGVLKGSPIARTLELSQTDEHKKLWENINSHRHGLRDSNNDGIRRARWDEKYAFLIEGATADWVLRQPPCDLTSTATGFYKRKYALAVANQSPLRDKINEALIELQFSNKFEELRAKWWPDGCSSSSSLTSSLIVVICTVFFKYFL